MTYNCVRLESTTSLTLLLCTKIGNKIVEGFTLLVDVTTEHALYYAKNLGSSIMVLFLLPGLSDPLQIDEHKFKGKIKTFL